jgi:hypothetical protein
MFLVGESPDNVVVVLKYNPQPNLIDKGDPIRLNAKRPNPTGCTARAGEARRDYGPRSTLRRVRSCRWKDFKCLA